MQANLERTGGLIHSERVLLALVDKGLTREEAYAVVQRNAMRSWETGEPLLELLADDAEVASLLTGPKHRGLLRPGPRPAQRGSDLRAPGGAGTVGARGGLPVSGDNNWR